MGQTVPFPNPDEVAASSVVITVPRDGLAGCTVRIMGEVVEGAALVVRGGEDPCVPPIDASMEMGFHRLPPPFCFLSPRSNV